MWTWLEQVPHFLETQESKHNKKELVSRPALHEQMRVPFDVLFTGSQISVTLFRLSEGEKSSISVEDKIMWRKYRYRHRRMEIMRNRGDLFEADSELSSAAGTEGAGLITTISKFNHVCSF